MCTIDRKNESESRGSPLFNDNPGSVGAGGLVGGARDHARSDGGHGVYWKPIWHILEGRFELVLANAAHIRNVPGRKSDVNDAVWVSDLLAHGVCTENSIRVDHVSESPNLRGDDRSLLPLPGPVRLAIQVERPT
jgi:hypothetical protein